MSKLLKALAAFIVILNCAWSQKPQSCGNCQQAETIYNKVVKTQEAYLDKKEEHAQNHVIAGSFKEMQEFELAQGEAYRFVCDLDKKTYNDREKTALMEFVFNMNKLNINSDAMSDINGCFHNKVTRAKKTYSKLAQNEGNGNNLQNFLASKKPTAQDVKKR